MKVIKEEKNLLILEIKFKKNYLVGLVLSVFGSFLLLAKVLRASDNLSVIVLYIIMLLIGLAFLFLAGKKEVVLDKRKDEIKIIYHRNLYTRIRRYLISDIVQIVFKIKSNKGFVGASYHYYLKIKNGPLIFLSSREIQVFSAIKSARKNKKIKAPLEVEKVAKFLNIEINRKKGLYF